MAATRSRFASTRAPLGLLWILVSVGLLGACAPKAGVGAVLEIQAPADDQDADVFVDGNYIGQVNALDAAGTGGLKLAPGVHRVEIRKHGRFPVQKTVSVARGGASVVVVVAELLEDPS